MRRVAVGDAARGLRSGRLPIMNERVMAPSERLARSLRVLLVEDNAETREITCEALRDTGYVVAAVDTIEAAVASAAAERPDVVLLDCRLPDGDGLALVSRWRDDERMRDVPVIVLTAFYARQDMEAALLAGVDAFLVKPCAANVLAMQIAKVTSGERPSRTLRKNA